MNGTDDIYSLESWLRDKALEAHNNAAKHNGFMKGLEYEAGRTSCSEGKGYLSLN